MPTITDHDLFECLTLVHARWADEFDLLTKVKHEKPDRKLEPDWDAFHKIRLANHTKAERQWRELRDRLIALMPQLRRDDDVITKAGNVL